MKHALITLLMLRQVHRIAARADDREHAYFAEQLSIGVASDEKVTIGLQRPSHGTKEQTARIGRHSHYPPCVHGRRWMYRSM